MVYSACLTPHWECIISKVTIWLKNITNKVIVVVEAYITLMDKGPYHADQVSRDFHGEFAFILYGSSSTTIFLTTMSVFLIYLDIKLSIIDLK